MSTPDQPTQQQAPPPRTPQGMTIDVARLPIPGNAEFALYLVALIIAWIVAWTTDSLTANSWFEFFLFTTVAYLLSRGIAKASRVLEQ
jgi:hypothetical protein